MLDRRRIRSRFVVIVTLCAFGAGALGLGACAGDTESGGQSLPGAGVTATPSPEESSPEPTYSPAAPTYPTGPAGCRILPPDLAEQARWLTGLVRRPAATNNIDIGETFPLLCAEILVQVEYWKVAVNKGAKEFVYTSIARTGLAVTGKAKLSVAAPPPVTGGCMGMLIVVYIGVPLVLQELPQNLPIGSPLDASVQVPSTRAAWARYVVDKSQPC